MTPHQLVEAIRLANKLFAQNLSNRLVEELAPFGKAEEYRALQGTDAVGDFAASILGAKRLTRILTKSKTRYRARRSTKREKGGLCAALNDFKLRFRFDPQTSYRRLYRYLS
jgi:hypothetical protein